LSSLLHLENCRGHAAVFRSTPSDGYSFLRIAPAPYDNRTNRHNVTHQMPTSTVTSNEMMAPEPPERLAYLPTHNDARAGIEWHGPDAYFQGARPCDDQSLSTTA
jgi:hypothetical protein